MGLDVWSRQSALRIRIRQDNCTFYPLLELKVLRAFKYIDILPLYVWLFKICAVSFKMLNDPSFFVSTSSISQSCLLFLSKKVWQKWYRFLFLPHFNIFTIFFTNVIWNINVYRLIVCIYRITFVLKSAWLEIRQNKTLNSNK